MSSRVDLRIFSCLSTLFYECIRQASVHLIIYTGENELSSLVPSFPHTHSLCFHRPLSALTGLSLLSQASLCSHRPLSTLTGPSLPSHGPLYPHTTLSAFIHPLYCPYNLFTAFALQHLVSSSLFLLPCGHHITIHSPLLSLSFTAFRCVSSLCFSLTTSLCLLSLSASLSYQPTLFLLCPSQPPLSSFRPFFLSLFLSAYMAPYEPPSSPSNLPLPAVIMALRIWASEFRNR